MRIILFLASLFLIQSCQSDRPAFTNKLVNERSPYLQQHAHNPVNWYPWGEEALQKAQEEDKLLLISVGYSSCHWCHVMEHESFSDTAVANLMNEHFVAIKVDREERPDIDDIYMTACQMTGEGGCGWPLNAFALPDGKPIWAGSYYPKDNWMEILEYFQKEYETAPEKMVDFAAELTKGLEATGKVEIHVGEQEFFDDYLDTLANVIFQRIDFQRGGRLGQPKFPLPNNYEFLLRYHGLTGDENALEAVEATLDNVAMGGIYDHLGGGFARYSVDALWKVPHFEKMLYDNGQLVSLYSQAFTLLEKPLYQNAVEETLEFVERELMAPNGGFYSALDADSEGKEGAFYIWKKSEIDALLTDETQRNILCDYYQVTERGNWEEGENILYRKKEMDSVAEAAGLSVEEATAQLDAAEAILFEARNKRERPGLDDKILASWNGLMLKGYIDAYRAFGDAHYLEVALRNANFIASEMMDENHRLVRHHGASINAFLDDYVFVAQAFGALYEVTFDQTWLDHARDLTAFAIEHFQDPESGFYHFTSDEDEELVARKIVLHDNVIPASNSAMARNLFYLGNMYSNQEWIDNSKNNLLSMWLEVKETDFGDAYSNWAQLYLEQLYPPYEVAIVGENADALRDELMGEFLPSAHFLGGNSEGTLELLKDKLVEDETFIYVCQNKVCKLPVQDAEAALPLMENP